MDEAGRVCVCGGQTFERVVVQRKPHPPIVTDFLACIACQAMYFDRVNGPTDDRRLKLEVEIAARYHRKPSRRNR